MDAIGRQANRFPAGMGPGLGLAESVIARGWQAVGGNRPQLFAEVVGQAIGEAAEGAR